MSRRETWIQRTDGWGLICCWGGTKRRARRWSSSRTPLKSPAAPTAGSCSRTGASLKIPSRVRFRPALNLRKENNGQARVKLEARRSHRLARFEVRSRQVRFCRAVGRRRRGSAGGRPRVERQLPAHIEYGGAFAAGRRSERAVASRTYARG